MKPNPLKGGFSVLSDLFPHSLSPPLYFNYLFFSHTLSSLSLPLSFSSPVGSGLVVCRLENAPLATEKESRLLFFPEMEDGFDIDNLSCHDRLSKAQLSIRLSEEEHNQSIPHLHSPTAWMALYADRYTCGEGGIIPAHGDLTFTILLFNPDSAGNPLEHFSAEEAGQYIHILLSVLCKNTPLSLSFHRYARDGVGIPIMGSLAEFCDMVSQVSMLYMLLSLCVGWTLSKNRKPQSRPLQWDSSPASKALAMGGVATQGALLLWEQYEETEHHSYHAQRSIAGLLLISLRIILALLLASVLYTIISTERSALKRDFYLSFAKGCFIWFLCHPVLVLLSVVFNEHQREKVVTIGVILCQAISVVILYQLFLSRSLYWEVSSLSSVSLPLTMSRGGRGRY
eukprot:XP_014007612.1 PREDICTED: integral membrane protein GPR180-like [Salmo salar]